MVKGISRQVIVVHAPEPKMFEQAIFILKDSAVGQEGVTDEALLKEAKQLLHSSERKSGRKLSLYGPVWACGGAALTGLLWLLSCLL
ncbi:MAG: translation initiation factor 2 [Oscillospiraceae bacterium]|nr:translation initiation factor 2 [Oscillospiraceae bacterium]